MAHGTVFRSRQHLRFIVAERRESGCHANNEQQKDHAPNDNQVAFMFSPSLESARWLPISDTKRFMTHSHIKLHSD